MARTYPIAVLATELRKTEGEILVFREAMEAAQRTAADTGRNAKKRATYQGWAESYEGWLVELEAMAEDLRSAIATLRKDD